MASIKLTKGQDVRLNNGHIITVIEELGRGGQGIVYKVLDRETGKEKALKWYFPSKLKNPTQFYEKLRDSLIYKGAPSEIFVWPEAITE